MTRRSLGSRIVAGVVAVTALVVLVGAVVTWLAAREVLERSLDRELEQRSERLRRMAGFAHRLRPPPPPPAGPATAADQRQRNDRHLVQLVEAEGGREVLRFGELPEGLRLADPAAADGERRVLELPDSHRLRVLHLRLERPPAPGSTAAPTVLAGAVALDLAPVDDELARLAAILAALWAGSTVLAWLAALPLRAAVLRPLRDLGARIDGLGADDLAARVPDDASPAEVAGMVVRLNGLLGRLEQAFRREQATIAAIAHELRTPVAGLRAALEFRLMADGVAEGERRTLESCLGTVERMQRMVADLLLLARLEAGREPLQSVETDCAALAAEVAEEWQARLPPGRRLRLELPETAPLATSPEHLRLVVGNLVGNAVAHGSGDLALTVSMDAQGVRLMVENPFAGSIDPARLGEAFWRGAGARSGGDHAGLGLALCRRLCRLLGAELALEAADGRFRAALVLPIRR
jgi:signal transduction histidine kinase